MNCLIGLRRLRSLRRGVELSFGLLTNKWEERTRVSAEAALARTTPRALQWTLSGTEPLGADQWKITQGNDLLTIWTAGLLCESGVADGRYRRVRLVA